MKIGDRVSARPQTFGKEHMEGEVVWIHPQGRFALVEFTFEPNAPTWLSKGKLARIRECFHMARKTSREEEERLRQEKLVKLPGDSVKK